MIVKDVLRELAAHNIYTKGKRFLTTTKISVMILINEQLQASQTGNTWSLSITDIMRITENDTKPSLFKALAYLCDLGFYETSPNPYNKSEQVYSPILTEKKYDTPLFIDFNWVERDFVKGQNLVVSPAETGVKHLIPNTLNANDYGVIYTLVSYNSEAFRNPKLDSANIVYAEAVKNNAPVLKNTWMLINNVKNIPHGLDLAYLSNFWQTVNDVYIKDKCLDQPEEAPVFPWLKLSDDYWNSSIPLGTREALFDKLLLQFARGKVTQVKEEEAVLPDPDMDTPYKLIVTEEELVATGKANPVKLITESPTTSTIFNDTDYPYLSTFSEIINSPLSDTLKELVLHSLAEYLTKH